MTQADKCAEKYGLTDPLDIKVKCTCDGCTGTLEFDGVNKRGDHAFMMCDNCGCTYATKTTKRVP